MSSWHIKTACLKKQTRVSVPTRVGASLGYLRVVRIRAAEHLTPSAAFISVAIVQEAAAPRRPYALDIDLPRSALGAAVRACTASVVVAAPDAVFRGALGRTADGLSAVLYCDYGS